jgi:hypothetical protein
MHTHLFVQRGPTGEEGGEEEVGGKNMHTHLFVQRGPTGEEGGEEEVWGKS